MAALPQRRPLTYTDYLELPDDGNRYELFEGELVVSPAPGTGHQGSSVKLTATLYLHVEAQQLGTILTAPCDVKLSEITTLQPDLLFVSRARQHIIKSAYVEGPPDLAAEILSPSPAARDRGEKMDLYARHGVPNYWVVELRSRTIEAYTLAKGSYELIASARGAETFSAPPFPDLAIPLARLWE